MMQEEEWVNLQTTGFPNYAVSNYGDVRNEHTGRVLCQSVNQTGGCKVGLMKPGDHLPHTIFVAPLVAAMFLPLPVNARFNTPINVDGDRTNNQADNLMMRPRWFAVKYHQQFYNDLRGFNVPVVEINTGELFETSWEAAIKYGLIDREIYIAAANRTYVFPTGQQFRTTVSDKFGQMSV